MSSVQVLLFWRTGLQQYRQTAKQFAGTQWEDNMADSVNLLADPIQDHNYDNEVTKDVFAQFARKSFNRQREG
jgi:hypothetical protein